jgi:predicted nuclease of predicted toxin-antitoxin system
MSDAPPLKFYTDTHIAKAIAVQLRNRGVEVVRCEEVGLAEARDTVHLEYATNHGLAVVTHDDDF